jgi:hypothetical protein
VATATNAGAAGAAEPVRPSEPDLPAQGLVVDVAFGERVYVNLEHLEVVRPDTPGDSIDWDVAFEGWDIYTNGGASGTGRAGAFGPNDISGFEQGQAPDVPFVRSDRTAGAFLDWYAYDASTHSLYSRYHVYGVSRREQLYKLQVLSYYGEVLGAPVSASFSLRYAAVNEQGGHDLVEIEMLNANAGGPDGDDSEPSSCLVLESGDLLELTPTQARESTEWDLCFRRDTIAVNGELGGPGHVAAVDLDEARIQDETLQGVIARSASSELERFVEIGHDELTDESLSYRGDRIVSGFSDLWYEGKGNQAAPTEATWLVRGASGEQLFLIRFVDIEGSADGVARVAMRVRAVQTAD